MKAGSEGAAPLMLGVILGGMLEENFRRAVNLVGGDYGVFCMKPISLAFMVLAVVSVVLPRVRKKRS